MTLHLSRVSLLGLLAAVILHGLSLWAANPLLVRGDVIALHVRPDAGEVGSTVELFSSIWVPDRNVEVFTAFSPHREFPPSDQFVGPIATSRANEDGEWSLRVAIGEGLDVPPDTPGYVYFRADSPDMPYIGVTTRWVALTVDGVRPQGSGQIALSISSVEEASNDTPLFARFGWRQAGQGSFHSPYSVVEVPFETALSGKADGDWELAVLPPPGYEVVGADGPLDTVRAVYCPYTECPGQSAQDLSVKRVTVADAATVEASFVLQPVDGESAALGGQQIDNEGAGGASASGFMGMVLPWVAVPGALVTLLVVLGLLVRTKPSIVRVFRSGSSQ